MDQLTPEYGEATLQRITELHAQLAAIADELIKILADAHERLGTDDGAGR